MSKNRIISVIIAGRRKETHMALDYAVGTGRVRYTIPLGPARTGPVTHWGLSVREHEEPISAVLAAVFDEHDSEATNAGRSVFRLSGDLLGGWIDQGPGTAQQVLDTLSLVRVRSLDPDVDDAGPTIAAAEAAEEAVVVTGLGALQGRIDTELAARLTGGAQAWEDAYGLGEGVAKAIAGL